MHANNREFRISDKMHAGERAAARGGVERERSFEYSCSEAEKNWARANAETAPITMGSRQTPNGE